MIIFIINNNLIISEKLMHKIMITDKKIKNKQIFLKEIDYK